MKVTKIFLASLAGAFLMLSCNNATEEGSGSENSDSTIVLNTFVDSLAYDFGAANSDLKFIAQTQFGVDSAYMEAFIEGMIKGSKEKVDTLKIAFNKGMRFSDMVKSTAENFGKSFAKYDSTMVLSAKLMVDGILDGYNKKADVEKAEGTVAKAFKAFESNDDGFIINYDTLAYFFGVANSDLALIAQNLFGVNPIYMDQFVEGLKSGAKLESDAERQLASAFGEEFGQTVKNTAEQLESFVFEGASTKKLDVAIMLQGVLDGYRNKINVEAAKERNQKRMEAIERTKMLAKYAPVKEEGEKFLAENAKKEGVMTTKSGLQYKVLVEGKGALPTDTSLVKVKYEGRFINGEVFDSNLDKDGTLDVKMEQAPVIKGWMEVLKLMPAGSKWEVYIPYDLAYGEKGNYKIEPFTALIFTMEIIDVE